MSELLVLPEGIGTLTAGLVVAATLLTSLIGATFGVGGGTILLAVLAVLLPPAALIPVHAVVQVSATSVRAVLLIGHLQRYMLVPFALGTATGSALSGVMFVQLPPWLIQYLVAGFITWSVLGRLPPFGRRHIVAAGAFSGFLTMLFGATGPFVSAFVKSVGLPPAQYVATHAALMTLQHGLKIAVFGILGFAFAPYALLVGLMIAGGFVGTLIGSRILLNVSQRRYKPFLDAILLLLAARLLWQATATLLAR